MNKRDQRIRKFNPGTFQSDEEVKEQFVVRERELGTMLEVLRGNIDSPSCQHVLIVAPRGRGKTMLLARVAAEVNTVDKLSESLLPVRFMEESHEIFGLADFWLETLFYLARESVRHDSVLAEELENTYADLTHRWHEQELADRAHTAVLEAADRLGKRLVLMVENLQALCTNVDKDFGWKLRAVLQSDPQIMLLATATSRFEGLDDAKQPFFELFRIIGLERLATEECGRLWQVVSGDEVSSREIRPLEILTGGSPRLLVIVASFVQHRSLRQLMEELVELIDEHTEYFRGHLEVLAKGERRVYIAVIDLWQPSSTGEIAARARMDVRTVSTMLGRLASRGVVIVEGSGKKRLYSAAERLYGIYYKLRRERDEATVVANLIHFMTVFYSREELAEMSAKLIAEARQLPAIREGIEREIAEKPQFGNLISEASPSMDPTSGPDAELDSDGVKQLFQEITTAFNEGAFDKVIETVDKAFPVRSANWFRMPDSSICLAFLNKATAHEERGEFEAAIAAYDEVITRFGRTHESGLQARVARAIYGKGNAERRRGKVEAAIAAYDEVIIRFDTRVEPPFQVPVAWSLSKKGDVYKQVGEVEAAMSAYEEVIARFGSSEDLPLQVQVAWAFSKKGDVCKEQGATEEAISAYDEVIMRFGSSDESSLQVPVAWAWSDKGAVHKQRGAIEAAIAAYDEVIKRFGTSEESRLQARVGWAFSKKADIYKERGEIEAAMLANDEVIMRFGSSNESSLQVRVAWAFSKKADMYKDRGEIEELIAAYDEVIIRFGSSEELPLQARVAWAFSKKGDAYKDRGEIEEAMSAYDEVIIRFGSSDESSLQVPVAWAWSDKGDVYWQRGEIEEAIGVYDKVISRFGSSKKLSLQVLVARAFSKKSAVYRERGEIEEAIAAHDEIITRFGSREELPLQVRVAWAFSTKGDMYKELGEIDEAIVAYDEVITRFGNKAESDFQVVVAWAWFDKGDVYGQRGEIEKAIVAYDEVINRYGTSDESPLQIPVCFTLLKKSMGQIQMGNGDEALFTCKKLELRIRTLPEKEKNKFTWRARCTRALALLVLERHQAAMDMFRYAFGVFEPKNETMMSEMLEVVPYLVEKGASARDLVDILLSDRTRSRTLDPLVVALRLHTGESVRAPAEVLEVAADFRERIDKAAERRVDPSVTGRTESN